MSTEQIRTKTIEPDFPFYYDNPRIAKWGTALFAAAVIYLSLSR